MQPFSEKFYLRICTDPNFCNKPKKILNPLNYIPRNAVFRRDISRLDVVFALCSSCNLKRLLRFAHHSDTANKIWRGFKYSPSGHDVFVDICFQFASLFYKMLKKSVLISKELSGFVQCSKNVFNYISVILLESNCFKISCVQIRVKMFIYLLYIAM